MFNNSWMQLHVIFKFGSFVVLLDLLKIFQNLFVQMFDKNIYGQSKFPPYISYGEAVKCSICYNFSQTCNGAKPHVSVVNTFTITTNHLVG